MPPIIYNPSLIFFSSIKENTTPQQYMGVSYDGTSFHYYAKVPLGTGIVYHRADGPALTDLEGNKSWWFEDKRIDCHSQEEFQKLIKLKVFW